MKLWLREGRALPSTHFERHPALTSLTGVLHQNCLAFLTHQGETCKLEVPTNKAQDARLPQVGVEHCLGAGDIGERREGFRNK